MLPPGATPRTELLPSVTPAARTCIALNDPRFSRGWVCHLQGPRQRGCEVVGGSSHAPLVVAAGRYRELETPKGPDQMSGALAPSLQRFDADEARLLVFESGSGGQGLSKSQPSAVVTIDGPRVSPKTAAAVLLQLQGPAGRRPGCDAHLHGEEHQAGHRASPTPASGDRRPDHRDPGGAQAPVDRAGAGRCARRRAGVVAQTRAALTVTVRAAPFRSGGGFEPATSGL